jgi:hypothetical protein
MKEALKLALEALENALNKPMWDRPKMTKTITAIKEALAQPEHEPVEDVVAYHADGTRTVRIAPKRPWAGLTDEDTFEIGERLGLSDIAWVDLMQAIEAKLKEKNT